MPDFDVIVVGAGPAGAAAAIEVADAGRSVCLLERGPYPGSKNMYGGVVYGRILDSLVPNWWEQAPIQRWVTRRSTMIMDGDRALTVDYRSDAWGHPPYNGATAYRPDFDAWLAGIAEARGATLVCSTTATGLLRESGRIVGVRTDRPDGELTADVVIACDGVNSFLAKEAGMYHHGGAENFTLGVKETIALHRGRHRRPLRRAGRPRRRLRDPGLHRRRAGRRIPLHECREPLGRTGAEPAEARGERSPTRGPHRRAEVASRHCTSGRGWRGQGVLGARHPRGRLRHDAGADHRRDARRRRRRSDVPGRGDLARGRQLRDRQRRRSGSDAQSARCAAGTPRQPGSRGTARASSRASC